MLQGVFEALLIVLEHVPDLGNLLLAEGNRLCLARFESGASASMNLGRHRLSAEHCKHGVEADGYLWYLLDASIWKRRHIGGSRRGREREGWGMDCELKGVWASEAGMWTRKVGLWTREAGMWASEAGMWSSEARAHSPCGLWKGQSGLNTAGQGTGLRTEKPASSTSRTMLTVTIKGGLPCLRVGRRRRTCVMRERCLRTFQLGSAARRDGRLHIPVY